MAALLANHPQTTSDTDGSHAFSPDFPRVQVTPFTPAEVLAGVQKFPRGAAGGATGFSPAQFLELCSVPSVDDNQEGFLGFLTNFFSHLAAARVPAFLASWLSAALLTPLRKRDEGVRPIAVGKTFRHLVSSTLMTRVASKGQKLLEPTQLGVKTSGGYEAVVHATRRFLHSHGAQSSHALLQVDLTSAFNYVSRSSFLKATRENLPELYSWVAFCYASELAHLWTGDESFRSIAGVQQGDPLGPLLFALALKPVIDRLQTLLPPGPHRSTNLPRLLHGRWSHHRNPRRPLPCAKRARLSPPPTHFHMAFTSAWTNALCGGPPSPSAYSSSLSPNA